MSWCLYDFANSAFTTLVVTFIYAPFFTQVIVGDTIRGTELWSRAITISALLIAGLSPVMGAIADRGGHRKRFLLAWTAVAIGFAALLYLPVAGQVGLALVIFVVGNVAFEMASVFYNAFLPDVAPADRIGRISGYGWALGYVGGLLAMALALVALVQPEVPWFGLSRDGHQNLRATNLLVAVWFAAFCWPIFAFVREDRSGAAPPGTPLVRAAIGELKETWQEVRKYRQVVRLLLARLLYNDGLITVFSFGGIYAQDTFGFAMQDILVFGIVLNVTAGLGAFTLGFLDDRLGGKRTIQLSLIGLSLATVLAVAAPNRTLFWAAAIVIGIFSGPNQAASRSLLGRFVPPDKENEFFGFFAFSGKATAFLGPALLGLLTRAFDSQRAGVAVVLLFFVAGLAILRGLDERDGIAAAGRGA